ncbi:MAG: peptidylprolyl isomerase [Gemmatimonadota bacterium]
MRENTKWIMLVTALAFVALMVFEWGMDMSGQSSAQFAGGDMGRVNGEIVSFEEYNAIYRNLYQQQQNTMEGPITAAIEREIENAAWEQVVMEKLLQQEMQRRGIRVTDEEVREAAMSSPPPELTGAPAFQTEGQFDMTKYQQFLSSPSLDPAFLQQLETYYRDVIPRSKLYFENTAGLTVTDEQLWRMFRDGNETTTALFVAFDPSTMVADADVPVSDEAVREYYEENSDDFVQPAQATVKYVSLDASPAAADSAAARQQAETYRAAIAGGEDFEAVALRAAAAETATRTSGQQFGVTRGQTAPAIDQAIFATAAGGLTQPILTQAGYHLLEIESRAGDSAQVRQLLVPIERSRPTEDLLLDRADSLENAAAEAGLESAANALGLTVRTSQIASTLPLLPGIGPVEEGLDWALEAAVGQVSDVFESENAFYILELVSQRPEGELPLEEAAPTIRTVLVQRGKIERARELLAEAEQKARAGEPLATIGAAHGAMVEQAGPFSRGDFVPGLGRMNAAIGAAFGVAPGQVSPLVEAENRLFLIQGVDHTAASREAWQAQLEQQRAQAMQSLADTRWSQFLRALREEAEIEDNRRELMRQNAAANAGL